MPGASIVVPTLNEAAGLEATLRHLRSEWPGAETVVADGGSTDDTLAAAARADRIVRAPRGRASQMNAGAAAAAGDLLFFLHADCRLPAGAAAAITAATDKGAEAGAFSLRFEPATRLLNLYAGVTRLPVPAICFGDRGLFVTRRAFGAIGGFPDWPLFEDVEMVCRLHRAVDFRFLRPAVTTSSRRFQEYGVVRQQVRNSALWLAWLAGIPPQRLARYYRYPTGDRTP